MCCLFWGLDKPHSNLIISPYENLPCSFKLKESEVNKINMDEIKVTQPNDDEEEGEEEKSEEPTEGSGA